MFLSEIKYIPSEFCSPLAIWVFGDYIANVISGDQKTIFLLHDKKVAESYRNYYQAQKNTKKNKFTQPFPLFLFFQQGLLVQFEF